MLLENKRFYNLDFIKVFAIASVVMIHTASKYSSNNNWALLFDATSRLAVPLFVMVSGSLLLTKEFPPEKLCRYLLKTMEVWFVWSVLYVCLYYVLLPMWLGESLNIKWIVTHFYQGHYHLWYLPMLMGLYLLTPILRILTKVENQKIILYLLGLALFFNFSLPILNFLLNKILNSQDILLFCADKFYMQSLTGFYVYYIVGWYVFTFKISYMIRKIIYFLGMIGWLGTWRGMYFFEKNPVFYSSLSINVFFYSLAVFIYAFYRYKDYKNEQVKKIFFPLSVLTMGIYLIHPIFVDLFDYYFSFINPYFQGYFLILWGLVFIGSTIVSYIISRIPLIRKIIKC